MKKGMHCCGVPVPCPYLFFPLLILTLFVVILQHGRVGEFRFVNHLQSIAQKVKSVKTTSECGGISVNELIRGLPQNDSRILDYIHENHLSPPSLLPYNLSDPTGDPGDYIGQNAAVQRILGKIKYGFFIDAGAHDGEYLSNTIALERDFGWTGLLVEPSPIEIPNLRMKHRKAWISDVCLSPTGIPSSIDFLHRVNYTIASKLGTAEDIGDYKDIWKVYKVPCFPIFSLISAMGVTTVDYFSLDVEGVELQVLKTIPFDSILIKVFSIEYNMIPEDNDGNSGKKLLKKFMESKGYIFTEELYHDYIFVHKSLNYKLPVTPIDSAD